MKQVLKSQIDNSVNFVKPQEVGFLEARYVRRNEQYFIIYLSSQSGCNRGCKFCHLTATGQTQFTNATPEEFLSQAQEVMNYYKTQLPAQEVNYNWMSRGEALANPQLLEHNQRILKDLTDLAVANNLAPKFNVSTIMPKSLGIKKLSQIFRGYTPTLYYSLYSLNPKFRNHWMPGAMDPQQALENLKDYQNVTNKIINLHWAFIRGENDSLADLAAICDLVDKYELLTNFNIVRYNPFSSAQGEEPGEEILQRNCDYLKTRIKGQVKIITRVGFDVKASCGMFIR